MKLRTSWYDRLFGVPNKPYALGSDEWEEWHAEARRKYPFRHFMSETLPIVWYGFIHRWFKDPWYHLKCAVWHRYNVVKCRKLPPTWCDRDHLMLHACFQILVDFVEKESDWHFFATDQEIYDAYMGVGFGSDEEANRRIKTWRTLRELYHWWKAADPWIDDWDLCQKQLHRLINVRKFLWT